MSIILQKGSQGPAVSALQTALGIKATGTYDDRTFARVVDYQNRHGLPATGGVTQDMFTRVMKGASRPRRGPDSIINEIATWTDRMTREDKIWDAVQAGKVPTFVTKWVDVEVEANGHKGVIHVSPDYFALGTNSDYVRMPMFPTTAQKIANKYHAILPTSKIVDIIADNAKVKLFPQNMDTRDMMSTSHLLSHNEMTEEQFWAAGGHVGDLVDGDKKDIVLSKANGPNKVSIYGWHYHDRDEDGNIVPTKLRNFDGNRRTYVQSRGGPHEATYADYSHGVRLVKDTMTVDGVEMPIAKVLADKDLAPMISDEGTFDHTNVL